MDSLFSQKLPVKQIKDTKVSQWDNGTYHIYTQVKINKLFQLNIVNNFLPIILIYEFR